MREILHCQFRSTDWVPEIEIAREDLVALKRSILDKLGVNTSVAGVVDVLKHDSILVWRSGIASTRLDFKTNCSYNSGQRGGRKQILEQHREVGLAGDAGRRRSV